MLGFLNRFVDSNDRELKRIQPFVDRANEFEAEFEALSDAETRARIAEIRDEIHEAAVPDEPDAGASWRRRATGASWSERSRRSTRSSRRCSPRPARR
jgi:preprotein translocase subunit SecA